MTIQQAKTLKVGDKIRTSNGVEIEVTIITPIRETADDVQIDFAIPGAKVFYIQTNGKSAALLAQMELI